MRIIGYHAEDQLIANSDGEYVTEPPFIDFLLEDKPDTIKVFYHMGHSMANILKMFGANEEEGKQLQNTGQLRKEPYLVKHRAGKFMSIKKGHFWGSPFANFSDMNQYKLADVEWIQGYQDAIAAANLAKETGEEVYKALRGIGLHPTSLTSPVNAYNKEVLSKADIPTIDDMPAEAGYYAYQCCQGNWLEAFKLGHWEKAYDYDINSAYPSELIKLLDIRLGEWVYSTGWVEDAVYGYCKGDIHITKPFSPVIWSPGEEGLNYTPTGTYERYLTKSTIEAIRQYDRGTFDLIDGYWWKPKEKKRVLGSLLYPIYAYKENSTGIAREVIKRVMSGIWGMFLQAHTEGFGELFNPCYGAEVESNIRTEVMRFVLDNKIDPICVVVDGVLSPTKVDIVSKEREVGNGRGRLGQWELASEASAICAGSAAVAIKGKTRVADFSLDYDWFVEQIKKEPLVSEYSMSKMSPVTMAVALNGEWDKLGKTREITKTIYIGEDPKRYYPRAPRNGQELLAGQFPSEPWDISLLSSSIQTET